MRLIYLCITFLTIALFFESCSRLDMSGDDELLNGVTEEIKEKADAFMISQVGKDFFHKHLTYQASESLQNEPDSLCVRTPDECAPYARHPYYIIFYRFEIERKPFIDEVISFIMNFEGEIISEREIIGIPNCLDDPDKCKFPIDEIDAKRIALEAGLEEGIRSWETSFHWHAMGIFVWTISNTLGQDESSLWGNVALLNANTGEVIRIGQWIYIDD